MSKIADLLQNHAALSPAQMEKMLNVSRSTLNRLIQKEIDAGIVSVKGNASARTYELSDPLFAIRRYFETPHTKRRIARYREELLTLPGAHNFSASATNSDPLVKKELIKFLIDFSCASSGLEGGTYSLLDTQALIQYGEKNSDKPLADAFLVLNHKEAFERLYDHPSLDETFNIHQLLTNAHGIEELENSPHFLPKDQSGAVREYSDVDIAFSTYCPPFRPGTGYIKKALDRILETADAIQNPLEAAFYLLTRIPYLQPFQDGNKRVSRVMCNAPLLNAGLPPISFADFNKKDYIVALLAFYELGDDRLMEKCFTESYVKSCLRFSSDSDINYTKPPHV